MPSYLLPLFSYTIVSFSTHITTTICLLHQVVHRCCCFNNPLLLYMRHYLFYCDPTSDMRVGLILLLIIIFGRYISGDVVIATPCLYYSHTHMIYLFSRRSAILILIFLQHHTCTTKYLFSHIYFVALPNILSCYYYHIHITLSIFSLSLLFRISTSVFN